MTIVETDMEASRRVLDEFYRSSRKMCCFWAGEVLRNSELVDDAVQEAFLRALRYLHTFDPGRPFIPWIRKIVRQVACDVKEATQQREQHHRALDDPDALVGQDFVADLLEQQEQEERLRQIQEAMQKIAPVHRRMLLMECVEDASRTDIATRLGIDNNALNCRIYRARQACRVAVGITEEWTEEITSTLFSPAALDRQIGSLIACMPDMTEDQLNIVIRASHALESQAFRVRGAATAELQNRMRERRQGLSRVEISAIPSMKEQIAEMAQELQVEPRTLYTDAQIHRTFFAQGAAPSAPASPVDDFFGSDGAEAGVVDTDNSAAEQEAVLTLDREYYAIALTAPDPKAAIELAYRKIGTPGFSTRQFRHDVEELRQASAASTPPPAEAVEETYVQTVRFPLEMRSRIAQQCRARNTDVDSLFIALLNGQALLPGKAWESLEQQIQQVYQGMTVTQFLSDLIRNNETLLVQQGRMTPVLTAGSGWDSGQIREGAGPS